jgi:peroxiredoxin
VSNNYNTLPDGLPVPIDDGQAAHLVGLCLPNISLLCTDGKNFNLDINSDPKKLNQEKLVIYVYPLTGQPNVALPRGWDEIPGARGCTPQACDFSDHYQQFQRLNTQVFGLSTQTTQYQVELKNRLHLPFDLLSDSDFKLKQFLNLPTFKVGELTLYKRLTLIIEQNIIKKVFYPVFPPNQHATQVLDWLKSQQS